MSGVVVVVVVVVIQKVISRKNISEITVKCFIKFNNSATKKTVFRLRLFLLSCVMLQEHI